MTFLIALLKPLPVIWPREAHVKSASEILTPLVLRDLIAGGIAPGVFPLVDSRTTYWRYYLLYGPGSAHRSDYRLGRKLVAIVKANRGLPGPDDAGPGAITRGIGSRLISRAEAEGKNISPRSYKNLSVRFRAQYRISEELWKHIQGSGHHARSLRVASEKIRKANQDQARRFFAQDMMLDGNSKSAFHAVIRNQTKEAREIAKYLRKNDWVVGKMIGRLTISDYKRLYPSNSRLCLAWAVLLALFRQENEKDFDQTLRDGQRDLIDIARSAIRGLKAGVAPNLPTRARSSIIALLRASMGKDYYVPPLPPPPLKAGRSRQIVYRDLRLSSFALLLRRTAK